MLTIPSFEVSATSTTASLEGLLKQLCESGGLSQGYKTIVGERGREIEIEIRIEGRWQDQEFDRFELVSDFDAEGFDNQYRTYGLGAPLIAVRKQQPIHLPSEKYYPPELSLPMTAFLHLVPDDSAKAEGLIHGKHQQRRAVLSLYDPLERTLVETDDKVVPLESDITTPLAYGLKQTVV